ncbi:amidohydrolase family protein [Chitinasiproducens palmae]|uniref:Predicted metal-dependent hydrolase, TIM-barrel fold n=1 Tax=Chitinasiproducens palmae TaxID=1770053 RepID=A0A1H2PJZ6_9BURK|nr:amidohydrolase family protein [Chitinasiproducens palmae]SDV46709.1 Predicted metal-dependent hydrolase, TIM-barrel fold [Chitinasiproducens palmae]
MPHTQAGQPGVTPTFTGASEVGRVDCHAHIMTTRHALVADRHSEPKHDIHVEDFLALLALNGLSHGVLTQPSFYGTDNSLLLDALSRYPEQLRGTAIVSPDIAEAEMAALYASGIRGVRLNWFRRDTLPDAAGAEYQRLFTRARDAGLHVELYVEGEKLAWLLPTIRRSGANVVVDHFGAPEPRSGTQGAGFRALLDALAGGGTWVKLSAPYRLGGAPAADYARALLAAGGAQRLVWGSDWPWVSHEEGQRYAQCLSDLEAWVPDIADRTTILRDTPRALFGF